VEQKGIDMVKKSLFATLGFIGLVAAGLAGGSAPAAAGGCGAWNNWCAATRCGPWNDWCRRPCGPWNGWCAAYLRYPGYSFHFGYAPKYRGGHGGRDYAYRNGKHGKHGKWKGGHGGGHHGRHR